MGWIRSLMRSRDTCRFYLLLFFNWNFSYWWNEWWPIFLSIHFSFFGPSPSEISAALGLMATPPLRSRKCRASPHSRHFAHFLPTGDQSSLCHDGFIEQLGKNCFKSLTTLLRIVQTTRLPTTLTPLLKANASMLYVPGPNRTFWPFKHSWRINDSSSSGLLMWCTWARNTPLESRKPSLVRSLVPQDLIPCSHQSGEGKPWRRGWAEGQCLRLSSHKRLLHEGFKG